MDIRCEPMHATIPDTVCDRRRSQKNKDGSYRNTECKECEMNQRPVSELCTECGKRPWNPKYSKIKKCSACVAKTRKDRKPRDGHQPDPDPRPPLPSSEPVAKRAPAKNNGWPVILTTIHSDDLERDTVETIRQAQEWVDRLNAAGIPTMLEIKIFIIPEEGRVQ